MKPVRHPPDEILRAYAELVNHTFLFVRAHSGSPKDADVVHALADAMHNVGAIFTDYGDWPDDEKYRTAYLRPFDAQWAQRAFSLEGFLESRLRAA